MKTLLRYAIVASALLTAVAAACPGWTACPLDGAQANLVNTEYQGMIEIGVYEHTTTTGDTHRFRMRCN